MRVWDKMKKERLSLAVIVSLLIIALFADLSWIYHISYELVFVAGLLLSLTSPAGFIILFPAVPIIYGWITKNEIGAILAGVLPIIGFIILGNFLFPLSPFTIQRIIHIILYDIIFFGGRLSIIAGSAGYFASKRIIPVAILLGVLWLFIFATGIH